MQKLKIQDGLPEILNGIVSRVPALPRDSSFHEINVQDEDLINEFVKRKKTFRFELCIIPFNNGNGGTPTPIRGASNNGKSNYFPALSPDGKWLVFCQSENFMLLQPDSRMYIMPAFEIQLVTKYLTRGK